MGLLDWWAYRKHRKAELKHIEQLFQKHLSRMKILYGNKRGFSTMEPRWNKLLLPQVLSFCVHSIYDEFLKSSYGDEKHHYQGRRFEDIYVAVSAISTGIHWKARACFKEGYLGFLNVLLNESGFGAGDCDLAHWIYCKDPNNEIVHLAFLPAIKLMKTETQDIIKVLPQNLMTEAEKLQMGLRRREQAEITEGMTMGQVYEILGEPHAITTMGEYLSRSKLIIGDIDDERMNDEYWLYTFSDSEYQIVIRGGRVSKVARIRKTTR